MDIITSQFAVTIAEVIRDVSAVSSFRAVHSDELYLRLMGRLSAVQYRTILDALKAENLVAERGSLLYWIGPPKVCSVCGAAFVRGRCLCNGKLES